MKNIVKKSFIVIIIALVFFSILIWSGIIQFNQDYSNLSPKEKEEYFIDSVSLKAFTSNAKFLSVSESSLKSLCKQIHKPIILYTFNDLCKPSMLELNNAVAYQTEDTSKVVIFVVGDMSYTDTKIIENKLKKIKFKYPVLLIDNDKYPNKTVDTHNRSRLFIKAISTNYNNEGEAYPYYLVLNEDGKVIKSFRANNIKNYLDSLYNKSGI